VSDATDPAAQDGADINTDITALILADHDTFRRGFAALDEAQSPDTDPATAPARLAEIWTPLADLLDVHAVAEERIFYPRLLRAGDADDAVDETLDAVGDHNDIRDAVHAAARHRPGSAPWWDEVNKARAANTEHMAEEEDEALADFRRHTTRAQRADLGRQFAEFKQSHSARDLDTSDQDPQRYVAEHRPGPPDASLGIGSLR
jgi:hypothetical protein